MLHSFMTLSYCQRLQRWRIKVERCQLCLAGLSIAAPVNLPVAAALYFANAKIGFSGSSQGIRRIKHIIDIGEHAVEYEDAACATLMVVYAAELSATPANDVDLETRRFVDRSIRELAKTEGEVLSPLEGGEAQPRSKSSKLLDLQCVVRRR
ncbi:hypothetical protein CA85_50560 [Allorhodopirellula solitaria]|uniref:Uncharacterized protein n=1 Tax=Allorhodopirellula solitaria TaxID=2527987 RepID=A0A5C5WQS2_9BACT|nr:hypothetical protein CA85_50560 [Allorhodopirellula solitaria]